MEGTLGLQGGSCPCPVGPLAHGSWMESGNNVAGPFVGVFSGAGPALTWKIGFSAEKERLPPTGPPPAYGNNGSWLLGLRGWGGPVSFVTLTLARAQEGGHSAGREHSSPGAARGREEACWRRRRGLCWAGGWVLRQVRRGVGEDRGRGAHLSTAGCWAGDPHPQTWQGPGQPPLRLCLF